MNKKAKKHAVEAVAEDEWRVPAEVSEDIPTVAEDIAPTPSKKEELPAWEKKEAVVEKVPLSAEKALEMSRKYKMSLDHILHDIEREAWLGHRKVTLKQSFMEESTGEKLRELGYHVAYKSFDELTIEW